MVAMPFGSLWVGLSSEIPKLQDKFGWNRLFVRFLPIFWSTIFDANPLSHPGVLSFGVPGNLTVITVLVGLTNVELKRCHSRVSNQMSLMVIPGPSGDATGRWSPNSYSRSWHVSSPLLDIIGWGAIWINHFQSPFFDAESWFSLMIYPLVRFTNPVPLIYEIYPLETSGLVPIGSMYAIYMVTFTISIPQILA